MTDGLAWGLFGARSDHRGLSIQSTEIARNLHPDRVLGIDMGAKSPLPCDWSAYDPTTLTVRRLEDLTPADAAEWMAGLDVVFGCETFYVPWLTDVARQTGTATVMQLNPEFAQHIYDWEPRPTIMCSPTGWRLDRLPDCRVLPVGVARDRLPWRPRTRLDVVLHVVGHGAVHDRNGTGVLVDALRYVRRPLGVVIRAQRRSSFPLSRLPPWVDVEVRGGDLPDYASLYDEGDVLVMPRRYGGLALPAQEALSTGMPVLMPDASPNADWLPPGMLVPVMPARVDRHFQAQVGRVELFDADPEALAGRLDHLAAHPGEVAALSREAERVAERLAWPNVAGLYRDTLQEAATAVASRA